MTKACRKDRSLFAKIAPIAMGQFVLPFKEERSREITKSGEGRYLLTIVNKLTNINH